MALKRITKADPNIAMSSMTDIVFLLLIFFLVTSTLVNPNALKIGSKLVIPVSDPDIKPYGGTFDLSTWTPVETEADFAGEYKVQAGDTLWSIAKLFHTDIQHIAYFNHLELDSHLSIGKVLKVPTPPEEMDFF